jgi:tetratricopeptide (TPR) repeat protein
MPEAVACYRRAMELNPNFADAHYNLGIALMELGKPEEAAACYRRALELKPDYANAHNNLGHALIVLGKSDEAVACCRRALALRPDFVEAHNNLGIAFLEQGKVDEAVACFRRALELKPEFPEALNNLGVACRDQGNPDEAVACCRRALALKPNYPEAHYNLGNALKDRSELHEAIACYRRAIELKPELAEAHGELGCALGEIGDLGGAEHSFRSALRLNPRIAFVHCKLAQLLGCKLPEKDLADQRRLLAEGKWTDQQRLCLHFGLARVLDARGEYAEAADHAEQANSLQLSEWRKQGKEYDPKWCADLVNRMIAVCTADFFERVRGFGLESEVPVFIVGLPRSGTTLVEQILASHSHVFGAGEIRLADGTMAALAERGRDAIEGLRHIDHETARRLACRHLERLRALSPTAVRIVDKLPENYLYLGLLTSLFPRARFIHCCRDLRDVAVSCWMTPFEEIRWASDQQHIASRFHEYHRIMEHWREVLPVPLLEVDYEETVADLEGVARRLVAWCGLEWEAGCLEFHRAKRPVKTASAAQVRQPIYTSSVGRWRHYEQSLATLLGGLTACPPTS